MYKRDTNARLVNGKNKTNQPDSHQRTPLFFNQKQKAPSAQKEAPKKPGAQQQPQPVQEISLQSTTDFLLAAILQELKTQNMIELMKLQTQQEQEQAEKEAAEKMQERDRARFAEIQPSLYL
ncbi:MULTISPECIES: hypothetical protein [Legionella]|uniref:Coiled-coil protein n=1 Tax=Legionella steelei TaxID=947033 RepID=A0A0W0ZJI5_9GAMM|nr:MULTISPECIES: hypothetical protein [Legionella]KTD69397.1 coiled-coil protein [Legionella steelei]MBN9226507.1 hypothetical protein [Legionella steelei]OJW15570.1 MAG: hypothetical protein BGO44_12075 [Legionella sp. 39-23]